MRRIHQEDHKVGLNIIVLSVKQNRHSIERCNQQSKEQNESAGIMLCTIDSHEICINDQQNWIADSGASHHMTNSETGLINKHVHREPEKVTIGDGNNVDVEYEADMIGTLLDIYGNEKQVTITNVSYVPSLFVKLYSITTALKNGM